MHHARPDGEDADVAPIHLPFFAAKGSPTGVKLFPSVLKLKLQNTFSDTFTRK